MMNILVLGAGKVGSVIIKDLSKQFNVFAYDNRKKALEKINLPIENKILQSSKDYLQIKDIKNYDLVVGALPGSIGFEMAKNVLSAGKDYIDISFSSENLRELNDLALKNNVRCLFDFGLAPGLPNLIFGHYNAHIYSINKYHIYVGGLVKFPEPPFYYKATFNTTDVYEEYTRPARFIYNGKEMTRPALSDLEIVEINGKYYEAFLTDGVRSLLSVTDVKEILEKTIRYPGHVNEVLRLKSLDNTYDMPLQKALRSNIADENDIDETFMKIVIDGTYKSKILCTGHDSKQKVLSDTHTCTSNNDTTIITLYDEHDGVNSSMARTTGFTAAAGANLLANNYWTKPGVYAPEDVGENNNCYKFVFKYLEERGINLIKLRKSNHI